MHVSRLGSPEAVAAGLDYVEPRVEDLLMCGKDDAAFEPVAGAVAAAKIKPEAVNCFFPGQPAERRTRSEHRGARRVGVHRVSKGGRRRREGDRVRLGRKPSAAGRLSASKAVEQIIDNVKRYGQIAADHGVTIGLESLSGHDTNFITSIDEAAEVVRAVAQPSVGVTVDTYHMLCDGEGPESIRRAAGLVVHAHCAEKADRGPLGTTGEDQRPYFRALKDAGFDGRISLECPWKDLRRRSCPAGRRSSRAVADGVTTSGGRMLRGGKRWRPNRKTRLDSPAGGEVRAPEPARAARARRGRGVRRRAAHEPVQGLLRRVRRAPPVLPGDDIRDLDWRAYGKSDRYYVKQYVEETNLRATILLDASGSMGYRGGRAAKADGRFSASSSTPGC